MSFPMQPHRQHLPAAAACSHARPAGGRQVAAAARPCLPLQHPRRRPPRGWRGCGRCKTECAPSAWSCRCQCAPRCQCCARRRARCGPRPSRPPAAPQTGGPAGHPGPPTAWWRCPCHRWGGWRRPRRPPLQPGAVDITPNARRRPCRPNCSIVMPFACRCQCAAGCRVWVGPPPMRVLRRNAPRLATTGHLQRAASGVCPAEGAWRSSCGAPNQVVPGDCPVPSIHRAMQALPAHLAAW